MAMLGTLKAPNPRDLAQARSAIVRVLDLPDAPDEATVAAALQAVVAPARAKDSGWRAMASGRTTLALTILGLAPGTVLIVGAVAQSGKLSRESWTWGGGSLKYHAVAAVVTALIWIAVGVLFRPSKGGLVRTIIGKGNRLSTSKLQVLLWTFAVSYGFMLFIVIFSWTSDDKGFNSLNPDYLFLLGGPFAAALLAQAATASKVNAGTLQQVDAATPTSSDIVEDVTGQPSVTDAQFLIFNIVALSYFFVALVKHATELPNLPDTLVGLTSVSALAYVGAKVTNTNAPVIKSISIAEGPADGKLHPDQTVLRIVGDNLVLLNPDQPEAGITKVLFGLKEADPKSVSPKEMTVKVPVGLTSGEVVYIRVRTGSNTVSEPYTTLSVA